MAVTVFRTIRDEQKLFVQAPTGTGKTIASMFPAIKANLSTRNGYEMMLSMRRVMARSEPDYRGEFHLLHSGQRIEPMYWSPKRIRFHLESVGSDLLIVNQNYNERWICDNCAVSDYEGRVALSVQSGVNDFTLYIDDRLYRFLSLFSLIALVSFFALIAYAFFHGRLV